MGASPSLPQLFTPRAGNWLEGNRAPGPALHWDYSKMCSSEGAGVQQAALPAPTTKVVLVFPPAWYNPTLLSLPPPDINECAQGLHNCSQLCINTPGAHTCLCHPGFRPLDLAASRCLGEYLQCPATCCCLLLPGCPGSKDDIGYPVVFTALVLGGRMDRLWLCRSWWSKDICHPAALAPSKGMITCLCVPGSPSPGAAPPHALSILCPAHARHSLYPWHSSYLFPFFPRHR